MRSDVPTCPICKVHIGSSRPLSLYPSDGNDIDLYLANRHKFVARQELAKDRRAAPGTTALDRHMSREDQAKLLERLMDFRSHINSYVMGVNDVRMNYHGTEQEIYRLFDDLNRGGGKNGRDFKVSAIVRAMSLESILIFVDVHRTGSIRSPQGSYWLAQRMHQ